MFFFLSIALLLLSIVFTIRAYTRFKGTGVNYKRIIIPPFGHIYRQILRKEHFSDFTVSLYNKFPEDRFVGLYELMKPLIMLKDVELIKQIGVKDFEHFLDHRIGVDAEIEPIFGSNLSALKGQKWKDMRSTLSPAFTSSKIRLMVPFMVEVGEQMVASLKKRMIEEGVNNLIIDTKDLTTRYSCDVIATCAFGIKVDSMVDKNNKFMSIGRMTSQFTFLQILKFLGYNSLPWLVNKLKLKLFPEEVDDFFRNIVLTTMRNREQNNIIRPDMIHLLMEANKGKLSHDVKRDEDAGFATVEESLVGKTTVNKVWSENDLIGQAAVFFVAGFDTVGTVMTFLLYELAVNKEVQDKLFEEIMEIDRNSKGFDYNTVQSMKYLDMIVSEVLRKWPPASVIDRIVTKTYNLGRPNKEATEDYIIKKGEGVWLPIWAIHHDPKYYENPHKFDPERFSDENRHKIKNNTYIPFGVGPRNCIGSRFALCEIKVMVYHLVKNMELLPCEKTCIPAKLSSSNFNLRLVGGHWLKIKNRN